MRAFSLVILWLNWLVLLYFVGSSLPIFLFAPAPGSSTPLDSLFRLTLFSLAVVAGLAGLFIYWIRRRQFWVTKKYSIERLGGFILYLVFSLLILFCGFVAYAALYIPLLSAGERIVPVLGILVGFVFLAVGFPVVPKASTRMEQSTEG